MPMSCFSSTGQLQFDCYGAAAATAGEAVVKGPSHAGEAVDQQDKVLTAFQAHLDVSQDQFGQRHVLVR